jgi:uncharacterized short protein YbdD (DUF466 family)
MKPDNVLTTAFLARHPVEAARVLESLPHAMRAALFDSLAVTDSRGVLAGMLEYRAFARHRREQKPGRPVQPSQQASMLELAVRFLGVLTEGAALAMLPADTGKNTRKTKNEQVP